MFAKKLQKSGKNLQKERNLKETFAASPVIGHGPERVQKRIP
jgi:hypothetical protein